MLQDSRTSGSNEMTDEPIVKEGDRYQLFHGQTLIGTITYVGLDWPWLLGDIELTEAAQAYKPIFDHFMDEDENKADLEFDEEWFLENWYRVDEKGRRWDVWPVIDFAAKDISWRDGDLLED